VANLLRTHHLGREQIAEITSSRSRASLGGRNLNVHLCTGDIVRCSLFGGWSFRASDEALEASHLLGEWLTNPFGPTR
jgi:hypothetical protein